MPTHLNFLLYFTLSITAAMVMSNYFLSKFIFLIQWVDDRHHIDGCSCVAAKKVILLSTLRSNNGMNKNFGSETLNYAEMKVLQSIRPQTFRFE